MATMKDVARLAGVSHGTVSNVINGEKGVSLDKVRRVRDAMNALNYDPNAVARNLKMNKSMRFDVILPNIVNPALAQIYTGVSMLAAEKGYTANLRLTNEDAVREIDLLNQSQMFHVDGVLLMTCQPENAALFRQLREKRLNVVLLERNAAGSVFPFAGIDIRDRVKKAVLRLMEDVSDAIGVLTGPPEYTFDRLVHDSCAEVFLEQGRTLDPRHCGTANYDRESALREAIRIMSGDMPPGAIVVSSAQFKDSALKAGEILSLPRERRPPVLGILRLAGRPRLGDGPFRLFFFVLRLIRPGLGSGRLLCFTHRRVPLVQTNTSFQSQQLFSFENHFSRKVQKSLKTLFRYGIPVHPARSSPAQSNMIK